MVVIAGCRKATPTKNVSVRLRDGQRLGAHRQSELAIKVVLAVLALKPGGFAVGPLVVLISKKLGEVYLGGFGHMVMFRLVEIVAEGIGEASRQVGPLVHVLLMPLLEIMQEALV